MLRFVSLFLYFISLCLLSSCDNQAHGDNEGRFSLRINCGGKAVVDGHSKREWLSDEKFLLKGSRYKFKDKPLTKKVKNAAPKEVYQTARRAAVAYRFKEVPNGIYRLRLHFMDGEQHERRSMEFRVEGKRIMQNFNINEAADGEFRAVVFECIVKVSGNNGMEFRGSKGYGDDVVVSGIEILGMPDGTEPTPLSEVAIQKPANLSDELRRFAGGHVKLVWTQTAEDKDYYQLNDGGILYGLDTEDGLGERMILPQLRSYSMPLITPDGQKVIFTDHKLGKCFEVDFNGKGLRELVTGFASEVWRDPGTGFTWLYVREGARDINSSVVRYRLDDLSVRESVWHQSASGIKQASWFTLSGDGEYAADGFPWPQCGLAYMEARDLKFMGNGCWPAVSPDDSHKYFYFVGKHTAIEFFDNPETKSRQINLATIPGWTGRKLYHPRWSNNTRFITATAPQWMPETELYLGRFNESYTGIEEWFRITYNESADYFGDAWFTNGSEPKTKALVSKVPPPVRNISNNLPGLVFVWENERAKNSVYNENGEVKHLWSARHEGESRPNRWFGADIRNGSLVPIDTAASVVAAAVGKNKSITLTVDVVVSSNEVNGVIAYLGSEQGIPLLHIRQNGMTLFAGIRSSDGEMMEASLGNAEVGKPSQLIVTYAQGTLNTFRDGREVASVAVNVGVNGGGFDTLLFGSAPQKQNSWQGTLDNIKLFERELNLAEIEGLFAASQLAWDKRKPIAKLVVEAELIQASEPSDPGNIAPYTRSLAENLYQVKNVISGTLTSETIVVLQWVILGGEQLPSAEPEEGKIYRLNLEPYDDHNELSGEHRSTDLFDVSSPVFYDIDS